jgi:PAS domain S-box-containing protein
VPQGRTSRTVDHSGEAPSLPEVAVAPTTIYGRPPAPPIVADSRLRIALDTGRMAVWEMDQNGALTPDPSLNRLLGFQANVIPTVEQLEAKMPGELARLQDAAFSALELGGRSFELEIKCDRSPGDLHWFLVRAEIKEDTEGRYAGSIGVIIDITDRKRAEERVRLLAREVDHRANNLLSVVEGIVTLAKERNTAALKAAITGRVHALAIAHRLLAASRWRGADLHRLMEEELAAYRLPGAERITIEGERTGLSPDQAQVLAMIIHELATNAAKYGALSVAGGQVSVSWTSEPSGALIITWRETGGPRVRKPSRRGFGTTVIERALKDALRGEARLFWLKSGVVCEIELLGA